MKASGKIIAGFLVLPVATALAYAYAQREPAKPRFYVDDNTESDVWEIPVFEPHRLIATEPRSNLASGYTRWGFQAGKLATPFRPDSLNYQRGFITFHTPEQNRYGYYDIQHEQTTFLPDYSHYSSFTQTAGLVKTLYNTESVYSCWQQTHQLPWAKEIFSQSYGSTSHK